MTSLEPAAAPSSRRLAARFGHQIADQAGKARRYQTLVADLRTLETHQAKRQWDTLDQQRSSTSEELAALTARQTEAEGEIERHGLL